jgi:hypothetical protein
MDKLRRLGSSTPNLLVLYDETTESLAQHYNIRLPEPLEAFPHAALVETNKKITTLSLAEFEKYVFGHTQLPHQAPGKVQNHPTARVSP